MVERLDLIWRTEFPRVVPVPFLLRNQLPGRWARFHHLGDGKRYPETEAEYRSCSNAMIG